MQKPLERVRDYSAEGNPTNIAGRESMMRKIVFFIVYMVIIAAIVSFSLYEQLAELKACESGACLPHNASLVSEVTKVIAFHGATIFFFAPFVFLSIQKVSRWLAEGPMLTRVGKLPRLGFLLALYGLMALATAFLVNVTIEKLVLRLPDGER